MENITPEIEIYDPKCWSTDANFYMRQYYKLKSKELVKCCCGKEIKILTVKKHLKSKNHKYNMMENEISDLKKLKEEKNNL